MKYASLVDRFMAQMADGFVAIAPLLVGALLLSGTLWGAVFVIGGFIWIVAYLLLADGLSDGQSFGKRWFEMRVLDAETRRPCSFGQSFIRNVVLWALGPIDWLFIFGESRQRLGDRAAGTIVVPAA